MKKALSLILLAGLGFAGCDKIKDLTDISKELTYDGSVEIPGVPGLPDTATIVPPGGITGDFPIFGEATNSQQLIKDNNTSSDLVTHVTLTKLSLAMAAPDSANFNFMDTIRVYIGASGMKEELLGKKNGIPKNVKTVDLDPENINIKEYFLKDSIFFRVNGHFVEVPRKGSKMDLKAVFNLLANPLNDSK